MALVKLHKYAKESPKAREEIFINLDHVTLAQPARTEDQRPGTHLIFSNGTEMFVWENMSEFIPAAYR